MLLTKKYKIIPTNEQLDVLWNLSKQCTLLYNLSLSERKKAWMHESKNIKYSHQQDNLPSLKEQYPSLYSLYSKTCQSVLQKLDANFKSFFGLRKNGDKNAKPPRFKKSVYFFTIPYNQSGFKIENGKITFSHKYNNTSLSFDIPQELENYNVKHTEIFNSEPYKGKGDFFVSVVYETFPQTNYKDNEKCQAIDIGITKTITAVNTDGKFLEITNPRFDKYWDKRINQAKSRRDHCKKYSRRWFRINDAIRVMAKKKNNQIKDWQHKLSRKMVDNTRSNTIIVGDLDVKNMTNSKKLPKSRQKSLNRSTQNNGYISRFIEFLTYKSEFAGKQLIKIDESYTSKICYVCGKEHDMPLYKRNLSCDCGNEIDRDRNSAINIMIRYLSQNAIWTGYRRFACNLRQTGLLTFDVYNKHPMDDINTRRNLHA